MSEFFGHLRLPFVRVFRTLLSGFFGQGVRIFRTGFIFWRRKRRPSQRKKVTGRRVGHVAYFGQPPVRCLALTVDAKTCPGRYDAKAIVLYLSEAARGGIFVHANFFRCLAD